MHDWESLGTFGEKVDGTFDLCRELSA